MLRHLWVGCGVGGVMLTIHVHLHHEVDATSRQGWGDVNLPVHLHHEVDATSRLGWVWGFWGDVKDSCVLAS